MQPQYRSRTWTQIEQEFEIHSKSINIVQTKAHEMKNLPNN
jgi:hypothetical protein